MDKITELQLCLDGIGDHMAGTLDQIRVKATPNSFGYSVSFRATAPPEVTPESLKEDAKFVVGLHKRIHDLIDTLPGLDRTEEDQARILAELEEENTRVASEILKKVEEARKLKAEINSCLQELARDKVSSLQ